MTAVAASVALIAAGGALLAVAIALPVLGGPLNAPANAALAVGSGLGFVIATIALCRILRRLNGARRGDDGDADGWGGGPGLDPTRPRLPPDGEPDWWPQFERDLRAYLAEHDRVPIAG
jgi:hypothetical protein